MKVWNFISEPVAIPTWQVHNLHNRYNKQLLFQLSFYSFRITAVFATILETFSGKTAAAFRIRSGPQEISHALLRLPRSLATARFRAVISKFNCPGTRDPFQRAEIKAALSFRLFTLFNSNNNSGPPRIVKIAKERPAKTTDYSRHFGAKINPFTCSRRRKALLKAFQLLTFNTIRELITTN